MYTPAVGAVLMTHRDGSNFDEDAVLSELIEKHGIETESSTSLKRSVEDMSADITKEKGDEIVSDNESKKKTKKSVTVEYECEENRPVAEAIRGSYCMWACHTRLCVMYCEKLL